MTDKLIYSIKWHALRLFKKVKYSFRVFVNPVIEIEGVKIIVLQPWAYNVKNHIFNKDYETGETNIIRHTLQKTDRVLEIGTGLGFLAIYCARKIGRDNIISVEANPLLKKYHDKIFDLNKIKPEIIYKAIGNTNREMVFYIDSKRFWSSSLIPFESKYLQKINVPTIDINLLIEQVKPTYLILDVEGYEYNLINNIKDFKTIKKIQMEFHPVFINEEMLTQMKQKIKDCGFVFDTELSSHNQFYFHAKKH